MRAMKFLLVALIILLGLCVTPVHAQGVPLPHAFYGHLEINGEPADVGTLIEARVDGVSLGIPGNPMLTTEVGRYGSENPIGVKLLVYGNIADSAVINFYINGEETDQTAAWGSGQITELNLTVTIALPQPPTGNGNGSSEPPAPPQSPEQSTLPTAPEPTSKSTPASPSAPPGKSNPPAPPPAPTPTPSSEINWLLIGGIIAGVVVIFGTIIFVAKRTAG